MNFGSWRHLAEDVICEVFRANERQKVRHVFDNHRDVWGRLYGLNTTCADELGFHGVADYVRKVTGKYVELARDNKGVPNGWALVK